VPEGIITCMKQTRYCLRSPPSDVDCLAMSLAERVEVVEITRRPSVDDPVDDVEHNERQRKTFPRQFVDAPRSTFACVHVDGRPRRNYDRRTATSSRRLAVRSTDTGRPQLYTNTPPCTPTYGQTAWLDGYVLLYHWLPTSYQCYVDTKSFEFD